VRRWLLPLLSPLLSTGPVVGSRRRPRTVGIRALVESCRGGNEPYVFGRARVRAWHAASMILGRMNSYGADGVAVRCLAGDGGEVATVAVVRWFEVMTAGRFPEPNTTAGGACRLDPLIRRKKAGTPGWSGPVFPLEPLKASVRIVQVADLAAVLAPGNRGAEDSERNPIDRNRDRDDLCASQ
jgi:hypothetical protein